MSRKKIFIISIYILIAMVLLCGCSENKQDNLNEKIKSEVKYLDKQIIGIINKLNNITLENYEVKSKEINLKNSQGDSSSESGNSEESDSNGGGQGDGNSGENSNNKKSGESQESNNIKVLQMQPSNILVIDKDDVDWLSIKSEIEIIYSSWNTILLDLYKINIQSDDILNFSRALDNTIITAKDENKQETIANLANLYSYLPRYIDKIQIEESEKNILRTKSNILNAYALLEQNNWDEIRDQLNQADDNYTKVTNDVKYIENKQEQASRVYILIKELKNSINTHDKDIFYIKYKNIMNSI